MALFNYLDQTVMQRVYKPLADRLLMPQVSTEQFIDAAKQVVKANEDFVPPYGTGATLYLRPLLIGVGDIIGVKPAEEYIFTILPCQ